MDRRGFLRTAAAAAIGSAASATAATAASQPDPEGTTPPSRNWTDPTTVIYPDPAFEVFDKRFAKYNAGTTSIERIWNGGVWTDGSGSATCTALLFSDIPNNRIMRYDIVAGKMTVFQQPSHYTNGKTRDRQGRLVSCEQGTRRVTRIEYTGEITVLAHSYNGKKAQLAERCRCQV